MTALATLLAVATQPATDVADAGGIPLIRYLVPLVTACIIAFVTIEMVRRRKLREEYAMLWLTASLVLLILGLFPDILLWLQGKLQVHYLTIVVLACFAFLAVIVMHYSMVISNHTDQIRHLTQHIALLEHELEKAKSGEDSAKPTGDEKSAAAKQKDDEIPRVRT